MSPKALKMCQVEIANLSDSAGLANSSLVNTLKAIHEWNWPSAENGLRTFQELLAKMNRLNKDLTRHLEEAEE